MFRKEYIKRLQAEAVKEQTADTRNTDLDPDQFCLFQNRQTHRNEHRIKWYVYRSSEIRSKVNGLRNEDKVFKRINVLFRNMENDGPFRTEFKKFKENTKVDDMYHCHVWDGQPTYVVMWEFDEANRIINIIDVGVHENLNYRPKYDRKEAMRTALQARGEDKKYLEYERRGLTRSS